SASPTLTPLGNEKLLLIGAGYRGQIFDPLGFEVVTTACEPTVLHEDHTSTLLLDGDVLITGCDVPETNATLDTAVLYHPAAPVGQRFETLSSTMTERRTSHSATLLPDGRVLLVGGGVRGDPPTLSATAELYDPVSRT